MVNAQLIVNNVQKRREIKLDELSCNTDDLSLVNFTFFLMNEN